jgi:Glycosyl transferase family 2
VSLRSGRSRRRPSPSYAPCRTGTKALRSRVALIGDRWVGEARERDLRNQIEREQRANAAAEAEARSRLDAALVDAEVKVRAGNVQGARLEELLADAERRLRAADANTELRKAGMAELHLEKSALAHQRDELEQQRDELEQRLHQLEFKLRTIEQSTIWRVVSRLAAAAGRIPRPVRRQLRRAGKAGYWALTPHRMPARIRFLRERRRGAVASDPAGKAPAPGNPILANDALRFSRVDNPLPEPPPRSEPIDIVVCVHNALDDVWQCLDSVIQCTQQPYRLIIIDDGSAKETRDYVADFAATNNAVLIRNDSALGYTGAANCGLRASDSPWVVLLNSDTIVTKPWLEAMWAHCWRDPRIGVIGPLSNTASWRSVPELTEDGDWARNPLPTGTTPQDIADLVRETAMGARDMPFLNGFCYMIRREVIDRIGIFDEKNFANYGEENDCSIRNTAGRIPARRRDRCLCVSRQLAKLFLGKAARA